MTPRWTICHGYMFYGSVATPIRVSAFDFHDFTVGGTDEARFAAYDALVAAVRDQARIPELEAENAELREFFDACEGAQVRPVRCDDDCVPHREQYDRWQSARDALLSPASQGLTTTTGPLPTGTTRGVCREADVQR